MTVAYSKLELRTIYQNLARLRPPGGRPLSADELVALDGLLTKTQEMIAATSGNVERGAKVLEWRIENLRAPMMNRYSYLKGWMKGEMGKWLDTDLLALIEGRSGMKPRGNDTKRWARVTRFTPDPQRVDGTEPDTIGGKMPLDALVRAGVLVDDGPNHCHREGLIRPTKRGNTHVLVEIFEMAHEEVPDDGPHDALIVKPPKKAKKKRGPMAQAIVDGAPK